MKCIIFTGAPGVGKGTFAKLACNILTRGNENFFHLSLGDILRSFRSTVQSESNQNLSETEINIVKSSMSTGHLISDNLANKIVASEIESIVSMREMNHHTNFILDGYPRTFDQAKFVSKIFKDDDLSVIDISLERWIMIEKILGRRSCKSCGVDFNTANIIVDEYDMPSILPNPTECSLRRGIPCNPVLVAREDDNRQVIEVRFNEYQQKTQPLLEYFDSRGMLYKFQVKKGIKDIDRLIELIHLCTSDNSRSF